MRSSLEASIPRDELLRRIGRNVVNFQYLEATLRGMIPSLANEGTFSEWQSNIIKAERKHKKSSLGNLADTFIDKVFSTAESDLSEVAASETEVKMHISVRLDSTPEEQSAQRKALLKLVVERNRLVHCDVLDVDLNSPEQCSSLIARLDEQNTRIRAMLTYLNSLRQAHREALEELKHFMQSDEFISALRGK